ncbi:hypothetical protein AJ80_07357 [Polytolypa hystricis UAMH7299]|uniref:lytic cellulose monooxygenase (C4-dehydrogenating) n=1 Tax=Polytolypa hystricis (strain UAMH7299) TaxID=1447883 RepID=A0A2B7XGR2_POLH7|nr:hypothetical protein AJ80_07357 [Polytolypa hystricis UAMH7299]
MKFSLVLAAAAASVASAHYLFPEVIVDNQASERWQYIRQTANYDTSNPLLDVTSEAIRCYERPDRAEAETLTVAAGSELAFQVWAINNPYAIGHPGPTLFYMAKVPDGESAATWDGAGDVWFKIAEEAGWFREEDKWYRWWSLSNATINATIPEALPSGEYLLRVEHIGMQYSEKLWAPGSNLGSQFFLACAQLSVTGGGNGTPGPLVSFPGAYSPTDPAIYTSESVWSTTFETYTPPGPPVWPAVEENI